MIHERTDRPPRWRAAARPMMTFPMWPCDTSFETGRAKLHLIVRGTPSRTLSGPRSTPGGRRWTDSGSLARFVCREKLLICHQRDALFFRPFHTAAGRVERGKKVGVRRPGAEKPDRPLCFNP